ncbi:MAG: bifunctional 4-hydroxy-2-oxoglutarate aldolase/2-dehydro-3-deoxy-phosphogluconate aldolase, partial [Enterovibrio sp.]
VLPMSKALLAGGIFVFEIALRTPASLNAIALIAKSMPDALVGAGSVLNCAQFDAAIAAGARFALSPGITSSLLAHALKSTAPLIPGVATPSEVMQALEAGFDHMKFFPAEASGGAKTLSAIAAPLPFVKFCPTGGIGPKNVADYLALKCVASVGGSWMLPPDAVKRGDWDEVTRLSCEAIAMVKR